MNAQQLMERLFALAGQRIEDTVDTCKAGDPAKEVQKVALCCIASPSILRQAHAWGADLLITHEPTYHDNFDRLHADDLVATEKRRLVEATGMTIYRYHDHAHAALPDVIAMGELEELGWDKEEFDGQLLLTLHQPRPVRELAREIGERAGHRPGAPGRSSRNDSQNRRPWLWRPQHAGTHESAGGGPVYFR